ncbi:MAG: hypothetical protein L0Z62_48435, partial [Gemmataceae bacterium]|nr:hypothetical protein [Gemmataceae bacterium]
MRRTPMTRLAVLAWYCVLAVTGGPAHSQPLPQPAAPPAAHPAIPVLGSLLHVRFTGPPGMRVTFYRGAAAGRTLEVPFVVGLRPGYLYRV